MMDLFRDLAGPIDPARANTRHFRERFAVMLILAGCIFLSIFGVLDWYTGLPVGSIADALLGSVLLASALYMRHSGNVEAGIRACVMAFFIWFLIILPFGILAVLWFPMFPLAAFFGLGRREGMRWSLGFLLAVAVEFIVCRLYGILIADDLILFTALASLSLVVLTVLFYQRLLELFESAIRTQSQQLQQAQRMESIGLLASGVAHDFNNLLVGVMGNAELAMMSLDEHDPLQEQLADLMASAERGSHLVRQLLTFAGKSAWMSEAFQVNDLILETRHLMVMAAEQQAELALELGDGLPRVSADSAHLQQVLVNLLANALEAASPERPCRIVIRSGVRDRSRSEFAGMPVDFVRRGGRYVYVEIEDNGLGMDEDIQRQIFEPFFTTKEAGTGLGLAAVAGTVRSLQGALELHSRRGEGSCFTLYLPLADPGMKAVRKSPKTEEKKSLHGTVLLADDEDMIRKVGAVLLEKSGLTVLEAEDGRRAMEIFEERGAEIDMLILDYSMPEMNGAEVFDAVRRRQPDMPVLISSGYANLQEIDRMCEMGAGFIQKPFHVHELLEEVRTRLPRRGVPDG